MHVYELRIDQSAAGSADALGYLKAVAAALRTAAGLEFCDLYTPAFEHAHDPYNDHSSAPPGLLIAGFDAPPARAAALSAARGPISAAPPGVRAVSARMRRDAFPVGEDAAPVPLTAPSSSVVRYRRPIENEADFIGLYIDSHPPTERRLPGIRNIFCYLPEADEDPSGVPDADYVIGNEVVFDSVAAFNAAMASAAREDLRRHFREFPPIGGLVTHDVMTRQRVFEAKT